MKKINLEKLAGEVIGNLQENATNIFSKYSITSTRNVGDTIQNYLGDKCFPELLKKYSVTDVVNHTGGKDFPDITFTHGGIEYVIDVKTQRENTKFNMPNITSLERIKKFYTNWLDLKNMPPNMPSHQFFQEGNCKECRLHDV